VPKHSGAPDIGDLVTLRSGITVRWPEGETWLVVGTRGIEIQILQGGELVWLRRDVVSVV